MKKILGAVVVLLILLAIGLGAWLYPREDVPGPPVPVDVTAFEEIPTAFDHRWTNEQTFPFLGAAVIDTDGDGAMEVFVGGAQGQADALLRYQNGILMDRIDGTGLSDTTATYGATSIDIDSDNDTDLIVARHEGVYLYRNQGGVFTRERIPVPLLFAMIRQESAFDPTAVSRSGARGLMQLMPSTGRELAQRLRLSFTDGRLSDPEFNVRLGSSYFRQLLEMFDGNEELALAGYNGGPYRIRRLWRSEGSAAELDRFVEGLKMPETRRYVKRIVLFRDTYARLESGRA